MTLVEAEALHKERLHTDFGTALIAAGERKGWAEVAHDRHQVGEVPFQDDEVAGWTGGERELERTGLRVVPLPEVGYKVRLFSEQSVPPQVEVAIRIHHPGLV